MKRNIILVNLGSPDSPTPEAVGRYLREFLMDSFVIDSPIFVRWPLVNMLIVPKRKFRSAEAYSKVWGPEGSPLITNSETFVAKLKAANPEWNIKLAMRYGKNRLKEVLEQSLKEHSEPIDIIPLYPQYAKSSTGTCWDVAYKVAKSLKALERVNILPDFYNEPRLTQAFSKQIAQAKEEFRPDKILFSYHGLPESHITELDRSGTHCLKKSNCCEMITEFNRQCYRAQCFQTTKAIAQNLQLNAKEYQISFQSRLGRKPWIKPYTDFVLKELAQAGHKRLLVACPSFVADCLETLEEIQIQAKEDFKHFGGEDLKLVPSLNDSSHWVEGFTHMLAEAEARFVPVTQWTKSAVR